MIRGRFFLVGALVLSSLPSASPAATVFPLPIGVDGNPYNITSPYGTREITVQGVPRLEFHPGIDFAGPPELNDPIVPFEDGFLQYGIPGDTPPPGISYSTDKTPVEGAYTHAVYYTVSHDMILPSGDEYVRDLRYFGRDLTSLIHNS